MRPLSNLELEKLNQIAASGIMAKWRGAHLPGFVCEDTDYCIIRFRRGGFTEAFSLMVDFINEQGNADTAALRLFEQIECPFRPHATKEAWRIIRDGL